MRVVDIPELPKFKTKRNVATDVAKCWFLNVASYQYVSICLFEECQNTCVKMFVHINTYMYVYIYIYIYICEYIYIYILFYTLDLIEA